MNQTIKGSFLRETRDEKTTRSIQIMTLHSQDCKNPSARRLVSSSFVGFGCTEPFKQFHYYLSSACGDHKYFLRNIHAAIASGDFPPFSLVPFVLAAPPSPRASPKMMTIRQVKHSENISPPPTFNRAFAQTAIIIIACFHYVIHTRIPPRRNYNRKMTFYCHSRTTAQKRHACIISSKGHLPFAIYI